MFPSFSVKRPYTIVVAVIIVIVLGVVSLTNISTDLLPSINLPYAVVATTYIGASPEEVEMVVTKPIEQRMAAISNINTVSSISSENMSVVILEFGENTNMDSVIIEMRESLDMIKPFMPDGVGTPIIMKLNPEMIPLMVASVSVKDQGIEEASPFIETKIIPELESVEGVASVSATGLVENQIHVIIRQDKIDEVNNKIKESVKQAMQAAQQKALLEAQQQMQQGTGIQTTQQSAALLPEQPALQKSEQQSGQGTQAQLSPAAGQMEQLTNIPEINITKDMVSGILKGQNFSMPAGYITEDGVDYLVRTGDKIKDLEELKNLIIIPSTMPGVDAVKLQDVAEITIFNQAKDRYSKINGEDAILITIQKQTQYTTADLAKSVRDKISDVMSRYEEVEIVPLMDQGEYIDIVINSLNMNLIIGGILAILILILFLKDLRPTIIIAVSIPISLVTAFVMMYFGKVTLNIISLGGLALGVGMLVDNSIVVIENIFRLRNEGRSVKEAAIEGAQQVSGAIIASTLTTIAVFLPIVFTQGMTRQIFTDMGLTIAFSLIASLLVALTLVPMMAAGMLKKDITKRHRVFEAFKRGYISVLKSSLKYKWVVIIVTLVLFVGSIFGVLKMGSELMPSIDSGQLTVNLTMSKDAMFEDIAKAADEVMEIIQGINDVETVGATIGAGIAGISGIGIGGSAAESVLFYVKLKDDRTMATDEVAQVIRDAAQGKDYEVTVSSVGADISTLTGGTIAINIKGKEFDTLESISKDVAAIVSSVEGTTDVSDGIEDTAPELRIIVDKEKSISKGLTVALVFVEINKILAKDEAATSISMGSKDYDVYIKDERNESIITKNNIADFEITAPTGEKVLLKEIASVEEAKGFASINRTNQERYVTVGAELEEGYNIGLVSDEIYNKLKDYQVPEGYSVEMSGERKMINEIFGDLWFMLLLAIVLIYLIMVAQFQSLLAPFIIMFTIPLAFTGGFLALMITGNPLSTVSFIGLIILAGVVVNNGIVFVDYTNKMIEEGFSKKDAIYKAANDRIRPILMTALTTIFALSTMSFGVGTGTEIIQPMAITSIGGLVYATFLTLILVPVLYDGFYRNKAKDKSSRN